MDQSQSKQKLSDCNDDGNRQILSLPEVIKLFTDEFSSVLDKFIVVDGQFPGKVEDSRDQELWKPGCYVWWTPRYGVVKVGRSLVNTRKRALEHIAEHMQCADFNMADLRDSSLGARLLLFNIWPSDARLGSENENNEKALKARHWAAAVEIYLEEHLKPLIRSKREG